MLHPFQKPCTWPPATPFTPIPSSVSFTKATCLNRLLIQFRTVAKLIIWQSILLIVSYYLLLFYSFFINLFIFLDFTTDSNPESLYLWVKQESPLRLTFFVNCPCFLLEQRCDQEVDDTNITESDVSKVTCKLSSAPSTCLSQILSKHLYVVFKILFYFFGSVMLSVSVFLHLMDHHHTAILHKIYVSVVDMAYIYYISFTVYVLRCSHICTTLFLTFSASS